jgi:hypothetical protein
MATTGGPPPASGAWQEGDPIGERRFIELGPFSTETGFVFPHLKVAYQNWGELQADRSNAVFISHALTGDSHVLGPQGVPRRRHLPQRCRDHPPGWAGALTHSKYRPLPLTTQLRSDERLDKSIV